AGLGGASGREGLRVEVDDGAAAAEVVEGDAASVGGREVEVGGVVARGQLLGHRCPLVSGACAQACRLASATAQALVTAIVTTIQAGSRGGFADLSGRTKSGSQVIAAAAVCTDVDGWSEVVMAASGVLVSGWGARWVRLGIEPSFVLKYLVFLLMVVVLGGAGSIRGPLLAAWLIGI